MVNLKNFAASALIGLGLTLSAGAAQAATVGFDLKINDPIFNSANGNLNVPDFQLENTSDSGSGLQITNFALTIGDTSFNFDFVRIQSVFNDPAGDLTATLETVGTVNDHVGEDVLVFTFAGFDPGDIFRFEVDVDPDVGSPSQDFRNVLFPIATAEVTYSNGTVITQTLNPGSSSGNAFQFGDTTVIPLPAGLPLLLTGAGLLCLLRRGRRS